MSQITSIDPMLLLEAKLVRAVEEKKAQGWKIQSSFAYIPEIRECCLLGAQLDRPGGYVARAAAKLGISTDDAIKLEAGFMAASSYRKSPLYQLGAKLRAIYVK